MLPSWQEIVHICKKNDLCDTLDGLCYVFWSCISWVIIMSYFSIEVLLSWFSLFLIKWFFSQPRMKNLDTIFQWFLLLLPGFLLILTVFFYHILLNIFIPKISSPIFLSLSKKNFASSQLNIWCDNSSYIYFETCAPLWILLQNCTVVILSHHLNILIPIIGVLTPPRYPSSPLPRFFTLLTSGIIQPSASDWCEYILYVGYDPYTWWSDSVNWIKYLKVSLCSFIWYYKTKTFRI